MAMRLSTFCLMVIWLTHFVLSSWALLSSFAGLTIYMYTHLAFLACGLWAIIAVDSTDAVIMSLATLAVTFLDDIIILALYEPRFHDPFETYDYFISARNEYRFALGMCITNLILKPLSAFVMLRIYKSRANGTEFKTGIPCIDTSRLFSNDTKNSKQNEQQQHQASVHKEPPPMVTADTSIS